jgi:hypothetical protein
VLSLKIRNRILSLFFKEATLSVSTQEELFHQIRMDWERGKFYTDSCSKYSVLRMIRSRYGTSVYNFCNSEDFHNCITIRDAVKEILDLRSGPTSVLKVIDLKKPWVDPNLGQAPPPPVTVMPEVRREGEPASVDAGVSTSFYTSGPLVEKGSIPPPPPMPAGVMRQLRQHGSPRHLRDFYYKYEDNRRYYLKFFSNFSVIYKYSWVSLKEDAMSLGLSNNKFKKQYPGRVSRDYKYSIRLDIHYSMERPEPLLYQFKKLHRKLPTFNKRGEEISLFIFQGIVSLRREFRRRLFLCLHRKSDFTRSVWTGKGACSIRTVAPNTLY